MLKIPKAFKYKKSHKGRLKNNVSKSFFFKDSVRLGVVALKAVESGRLTPNHIECCKLLLNKKLKKYSQIHFTVFPHIPVTKKPLEIRMGKGKGAVEKCVVNVFSGNTIIEIEGKNIQLFKARLNKLRYKLPIKTQLVYEV